MYLGGEKIRDAYCGTGRADAPARAHRLDPSRTTTGVVERRLPDGTWEVRFDFRAKADRTRDAYVARWRPARRALEWDDGNCWRQMHVHARTQLM